MDLAQTQDFTAIVITDSTRTGGEPPMHHVRHLERLPRGTSYIDQVERLKGLREAAGNPTLVVDQTGVGRPVVDMLREAGLRPHAVTITAGDNASKDGRDYRVPKRHLVSTLQIALQGGRLKIAPALLEAQRWADELLAFQVEITAGGHDTYGNDASRSGHDDYVIATALSVWRAAAALERMKPFPEPLGWR